MYSANFRRQICNKPASSGILVRTNMFDLRYVQRSQKNVALWKAQP